MGNPDSGGSGDTEGKKIHLPGGIEVLGVNERGILQLKVPGEHAVEPEFLHEGEGMRNLVHELCTAYKGAIAVQCLLGDEELEGAIHLNDTVYPEEWMESQSQLPGAV